MSQKRLSPWISPVYSRDTSPGIGQGFGSNSPSSPWSPDEHRTTRRAPFYQTPAETQESQRLYMDNLKLWDCLALVRQGNMTMMTAINLVFTLRNADYLRAFPEALQFLYARFPDGVVRYETREMAELEDYRLKEENIRLHATVWIMRDNDNYQADSTLASIFRLDHDTFKEKFAGRASYEEGGVSNLGFQMEANYGNNNQPERRSTKKTKDSSAEQTEVPRVFRRTRSASAKRNNVAQRSQQPRVPRQRRSNSMWGREDFTSNHSPSDISCWERPLTPDPFMKRGSRSRRWRSGARYTGGIERPLEGINGNQIYLSLKRSPSAMGRIEGQSGGSADRDEGEVQNEKWLDEPAMTELQQCTAKLGLEVNVPNKGHKRCPRTRLNKCVSFAVPLTERQHRSACLDNLYFTDQSKKVDGIQPQISQKNVDLRPWWNSMGDDLSAMCPRPWPNQSAANSRNNVAAPRADDDLAFGLALPRPMHLAGFADLNDEAALNMSYNHEPGTGHRSGPGVMINYRNRKSC